MSNKLSKKKEAYLKEREQGFDLDFGVRAKVPEYNALRDVNMRHYFENEAVQKHLLETGQIDLFGRLIPLEKHRLNVIENEFRRAERLLKHLSREEDHTRDLVRRERLRDIERRRLSEDVERRREREKMHLELVRVEREVLGSGHLYYGSGSDGKDRGEKRMIEAGGNGQSRGSKGGSVNTGTDPLSIRSERPTKCS